MQVKVSRCVKVVGALTPHEVVDFQQMWLSPDAEARQFVLGEKPTKGGRRRRTTPQRKGAKEAGQEDPLLIGSTSSVLTMKHLLSDLWRTFDYTRKWQWADQERTKGSGNATHARAMRFQSLGKWALTRSLRGLAPPNGKQNNVRHRRDIDPVKKQKQTGGNTHIIRILTTPGFHIFSLFHIFRLAYC